MRTTAQFCTSATRRLRVEERQVIDFKALEIRDVLALGRYHYHTIKPGLATHSHLNAVEICYLERGRQIYRVNQQVYRLAGGDLFVVAPDEPHDTDSQPEDCGVLYWLVLRMPQPGESLLMLPASDSAVIAHHLCHLPEHQFPGTPALKRIFRQLFDIHAEKESDLSRVVVVSYLLRCILEVLNSSRAHSKLQGSPAFQRIADLIMQDPGRELSLPDLAARAHLSVSRFKARFKEEMGVGPHEFILRARIGAAKEALLHEGTSVTHTAMKFGFSSSQYFATVFKRFTQATPEQFRRSSGNLLVPLREDPPTID